MHKCFRELTIISNKSLHVVNIMAFEAEEKIKINALSKTKFFYSLQKR